MRTLRASLVGTVILALLGGLGGAVVAQDEAEEPTGVQVTVTQQCSDVGHAGCDWTASDPRLTGTIALAWGDGVAVEGAEDSQAGLQWTNSTFHSPEGSWTGHGYILWGEPTQNFLVLSGTGANEGWHYVASGTDPEPDGDFEWTGTLYEGELPPFPETAVAAEPAEGPEEAAAAATIGGPADSGARIIDVEELDERTVDLTIDSPAVGIQKVRLLLPTGFDQDADADWPVLYLLHGADDDYTSWTRETDVADLTADSDVLVVMPEAGEWGFYSDWWNGGEGGSPMWETFHLTEVRELLERNWQAGEDRAVAGLSMGGFGTMSYAGRHPELFKAAAAFSGVLNPIAPGFDIDPSLWGSRTEQSDIWEAHDPVVLAAALEGMPLYVSYGNGEVGPLDAADAGFDDLEAWLSEMNDAFVARLGELDIPVTVSAYGPGTHTWPYWERGLHEAMPMLLEALGT